MKVKCINHGNFKNITINQEYEVSKVLDGFYLLIANDGTIKKYATAYFEEIEEEVEEELILNIPEPKVDRITAIYDDEDDYNVAIRINGLLISCLDLIDNIAGSCGIVSVDGITQLYQTILNKKNLGEVSRDVDDLFKKAIKSTVREIEESCNKGMVIFSTNENIPELVEVMDSICYGRSESFLNPNSGNNIKIWYFYINQ